MLRTALVLSAGLLAALCFACVAVAPPPPPPPPAPAASLPAAASPPMCSDGHLFTDHIQVLQPGYDPFMNAGRYDPPSKHSVMFVAGNNANITSDLNSAFSLAPPAVQANLCSLTAIYINPNDCSNKNVYSCTPSSGSLAPGEEFNGAWGYRSRVRSKNDYGSTYISISAALWSHGNNAWALDVYENSILQYLAQTIAPSWNSLPSVGTPDLNSSDPTVSSAMTVLAAMSHELGHVNWAMLAAKNAGNNYNFYNLQNCTASGANGIDFFLGWDYQDAPDLAPPNRWRIFADLRNGHGSLTEHEYPPDLSDFTDPKMDPNGILYQLYTADQDGQPSQPWASFFAAFTPDEDVVETYVLYALLGNKFDNPSFNGPYLASLPLTIPNYTGPGLSGQADVPAELFGQHKLALAEKIRCLEGLIASTSAQFRGGRFPKRRFRRARS